MNKLVIRYITPKRRIFFFSSAYQYCPLPPWPLATPLLLGSSTGNLVKDISGNGHIGQISDKIEWITDDKFDDALAFEGKDG